MECALSAKRFLTGKQSARPARRESSACSRCAASRFARLHSSDAPSSRLPAFKRSSRFESSPSRRAGKGSCASFRRAIAPTSAGAPSPHHARRAFCVTSRRATDGREWSIQTTRRCSPAGSTVRIRNWNGRTKTQRFRPCRTVRKSKLQPSRPKTPSSNYEARAAAVKKASGGKKEERQCVQPLTMKASIFSVAPHRFCFFPTRFPRRCRNRRPADERRNSGSSLVSSPGSCAQADSQISSKLRITVRILAGDVLVERARPADARAAASFSSAICSSVFALSTLHAFSSQSPIRWDCSGEQLIATCQSVTEHAGADDPTREETRKPYGLTFNPWPAAAFRWRSSKL